jgi:hypothetical protein
VNNVVAWRTHPFAAQLAAHSASDARKGERGARLKSSELRRRKAMNGREDGAIREDRAATSGEKPLKGGCPWTIQHETGLADPRHGKNRERQTRSVGELSQGSTGRPRERGLGGVAGTRKAK